MFRPAGSAKSGKGGGGNSSDADSDWDTTVDFPAPGHGAADDKTDKSEDDDDDDFPVQPKPKTRSSLTDKGKEEKAGDGTPHSSRGPNPGSSKMSNKPPASASAVHLSPFDSDSRDTSPVPPFNFGVQDTATKNSDRKKKRNSPPLSGKDRSKGNRFEMSPTPKIPASMEAVIPKWDDSDAEQEMLKEIRTALKKEKEQERGGRSARKQIQEGGDNTEAMEPTLSIKENLNKGQEDKTLDNKNVSSAPEEGTVMQKQKSKSKLRDWLQRDGAEENHVPMGDCGPYQPFIIKNPDGKRFMYCFSEGSTAFYEVLEEQSEAVMPRVAEKMEGYIKRGWQEFFGVLRIVTSVFVSLVVEAVNFITDHIFRPLFVGLLTTSGNRLVKPLLAGLFNLLLQPLVIFLWNLASGLRHACQPLIDIFGGFLAKVTLLVQAFRLVEVNGGGSGGLPNQRVMGLEGGVGGGRRRSEVV
ncbi:uncharacterized protein LOC143287334 [Babylonia areolata]|uniref:uncharacterized protein LOC143287334 n=1 Tax=Babylonia areolata TaxID=304850 RepID=UPI003FCFEE7E